MPHSRADATSTPFFWVGPIRLVLLGSIMAFGLSGCGTPSRFDSSSLTLQQTLDQLAQRHHVCNVAVAVIKNRKLASVELAKGCHAAGALNADSRFQAASLSKPVFAYAVMKLAAQGKMSLDAPVMKYLPQGYRHRFNPVQAEPTELVTDPRLADITVRMALNHTSGLPDWASSPLTLATAPGAKWGYSGEGYMLLQQAVETVTGLPLDQFMAAEVFKPLGMNRSSFIWNAQLSPSLMPGTKANGAARATAPMMTPVAAFSLYTTAADYGKFLLALLGDEVQLKQITASPATVDTALGLGWGLGWGVENTPNDSYIWQWGNNPGYRAFAIASVRSGDGFVMFTNGENGLKLAEPIAEKILPGGHKLFQSPILGTDVLSVLCNAVHVCL